MRFTKLTIGRRLIAGFGVVLTLLAAVGAMGYWSARKISEGAIYEFQKMLRSDAAIAGHSAGARANVLGLRRFEKDIFLNIDSKEKIAGYLENWKKEGELLRKNLKEIEMAAVLEQDMNNLKTMKAALDVYEAGLMTIFGRINDGQIRTPQEGNQAAIEFKDAIHGLEKAAQSFSAKGTERMARTQDDIRDMADGTVRRTVALVLLSIAGGLLICFLAIRGITRPLKQVLGGLSESAGKVASASVHTANVSRELAGGASQQAAAIQETSSSLEELASMTKQNAAHADRANQIMTETKEVITKARFSMENLTASMKEICRAGEETSKIIRVIDEVAFQTNLLALNAAVEAARAGEAGAGFAVVADEVRNLAMRTAEAAKNTTVLIEETIRKVKEGSGMVDGTNSDFSRVENSSGKMGELVGEIARASGEQAQGLEQISRAVTEMDQVVQKNAGHAEESAAASEAMNTEAGQMKSYVADLGRLIGNDGKTVIAPGSHPAVE